MVAKASDLRLLRGERSFMQNSILEVKNLTKKFGNFTAVDNIYLDIKKLS